MHVRFACASYSGKPTKGFCDSLEATLGLLDYGATLDMLPGDVYIQRARNTLVTKFLQSDASHLFFLDDDVSWPAEAALRLIDSPWPVSFGAYPMKSEMLDFPVVLQTHPETHQPMGRDGWISATGAPAGFLCIKRVALELMAQSYPDREYVDRDRLGNEKWRAFDLFPQGVNDGVWWGEDFGFCNLWRALGGMIWCWPDIDFGHEDRRTGKVYFGNYDRYLRALPMKEAA